jgi:hypothetical protein
MSLIIYLHPWSESMTLAPSISWIPPKPRFIRSSKIGREIVGFGKKLLWELVSCVEVTFESKFHSIWSTIVEESKLKRKGQILGENHIFQRPPTGQYPAPSDNV